MVKTSKKNCVWSVQKKVRKDWSLIVGTTFHHRKDARALSNELNNLVPKAGRGRNRRYRVVKLIVDPEAISCQGTATV